MRGVSWVAKGITIEKVEERLEELRRLEMAGVNQPELDLGPAVILWTRKRGGGETWEVLPEWVAELAISDMNGVERACVYHRIPENAPMDVAKVWLRIRMERHLTNHAGCGTI